MSAPNPYQSSAPPMQTYPSVNQAQPLYPPAPPPPSVPNSSTASKSTSEDLKAVAKGVAGVARLMGKGAAALGTAAVKAGAASTSTTQTTTAPTPAPTQYGRGASPYQQVMRPAPQKHNVVPTTFQAPTPHSMGLAFTPPARPVGTCWCGVRDEPEMNPCLRMSLKTALFPFAVAAYPLGATLWGALQAHFCVFSCCMMHLVRAAASRQLGARQPVQQTRDVVDCWQCQAEAWVWLDNKNGNCWVCELPVSKRVLRGHVVEAPCQLCLWGSER